MVEISTLVEISTKNPQMTLTKTSKIHHMMSKNIFSQNWLQIYVRCARFRFSSLPVTFSDITQIRDFSKFWKIMDFKPFLWYFSMQFQTVEIKFWKYLLLSFLIFKKSMNNTSGDITDPSNKDIDASWKYKCQFYNIKMKKIEFYAKISLKMAQNPWFFKLLKNHEFVWYSYSVYQKMWLGVTRTEIWRI